MVVIMVYGYLSKESIVGIIIHGYVNEDPLGGQQALGSLL